MRDPTSEAGASRTALDAHSQAVKPLSSVRTDASHWPSGCTPWNKYPEPPGEPSTMARRPVAKPVGW